jgi:hypothetical protein
MPFIVKCYHMDGDAERILVPSRARPGPYLRKRWREERFRNSLAGVYSQFAGTIYATGPRDVSWDTFQQWHEEGRPLMPGR